MSKTRTIEQLRDEGRSKWTIDNLEYLKDAYYQKGSFEGARVDALLGALCYKCKKEMGEHEFRNSTFVCP